MPGQGVGLWRVVAWRHSRMRGQRAREKLSGSALAYSCLAGLAGLGRARPRPAASMQTQRAGRGALPVCSGVGLTATLSTRGLAAWPPGRAAFRLAKRLTGPGATNPARKEGSRRSRGSLRPGPPGQTARRVGNKRGSAHRRSERVAYPGATDQIA